MASLKKSRWASIKKYDVQKIKEILTDEECIALCSNCHRIITHFRFIKHIDEIFRKKYEHIKNVAKLQYKMIIDNINTFIFKKTKLTDPFKQQIKYGEGWKRYIIAIYEITRVQKNNLFTPNQIGAYLKISTNAVNKYLQKLVKKGLIILHKESESIRKGKLIKGATPRIYKLTDQGFQKGEFLHFKN